MWARVSSPPHQQINTADVLAFADRAIDTAEDALMHATRAFQPAAKMNLPLKSGEDKPLTATKRERIVVLGTGWGGHAISKVRRKTSIALLGFLAGS